MAQQFKRYEIQSGPSAMDLMFSLFMGSSAEKNRQAIRFQIGTGSELSGVKLAMNVRIDGMTREDGSGNCWIFTGYQVLSTGDLRQVKGFFNSHTRHGYLEVDVSE